MGATEHEETFDPGTAGLDEHLFLGGGVGGLVAGVLMGVLMHHVMGIMEVVGGLYSMPSVTAGWIFHLVHAVLFGLVFAAALSSRPFAKYEFGPVAVALLGLAWGVTLWMVAAGLVMPTWLDAAGLTAPALPNWDHLSGIGHLVYGASLGAVVGASRLLGG